MTLKSYLKYKESGVEWLGQVPEHWEVKRLKFASPLQNSGKVSAKGNDLTYVGMENVESWTGKYAANELAEDSEGISNSFAMNDVLFGKLRPYLAKALLCEFDGICSSEFLVLRAKDVLPSYLLRFVLSYPFVNQVDSSTYGTKMPRANWDFIGNMGITIPLIQEQTTIAAYLDQETARIDELIAHKTRFIELLKEKRSALITHAVTKGLNPNVKMKDSGVEWLGQVPEHWEVKRLKFVATYQNSNVDKKTYDDQKLVRLCNYTDVYYNEFITDSMDFMEATASDTEVKSFSLEQGNIIITKDSEDPTDIGIPAIVAEPLFNVVCGYHLTIIRTTQENCDSFVFRVLQSHPTKAQFYVESPGITRFGLGQDTIGGLAFALPTIAEQTAIAAYLDQETARIDEIIQLTEQSITLIKERRSALITAAVTGKVDVREQTEQKEFV